MDWKTGGHKEECGKMENGMRPDGWEEKLKKEALFPESELVTEVEPDKKFRIAEKYKVEELTAKIQEVDVNGNPVDGSGNAVTDEDQDMEETEVGVDKAFLKFQKRIEVEPEQVLRWVLSLNFQTLVGMYSLNEFCLAFRYARFDGQNDKANPLWVADSGKLELNDIPPCSYCSAPRTFELQVCS
jgi:pre-rRNA-processing protein TSR4